MLRLAPLIILCLAGVGRADTAVELSTAWDSRYVSEGRNQIDNGGLGHTEVALSHEAWRFGTWFAHGNADSYGEVNAYIAYTHAFGAAELELSATRLAFLDAATISDHDNELAAVVRLAPRFGITPSIGGVWSTAADGGYVALGLEGQLPQPHPALTITPSLVLGLDHGYASPDHNGPSDLHAGITAAWQLGNRLQIGARLDHSFALRDVRRDRGGDETWGGVWLTWRLPVRGVH